MGRKLAEVELGVTTGNVGPKVAQAGGKAGGFGRRQAQGREGEKSVHKLEGAIAHPFAGEVLEVVPAWDGTDPLGFYRELCSAVAVLLKMQHPVGMRIADQRPGGDFVDALMLAALMLATLMLATLMLGDILHMQVTCKNQRHGGTMQNSEQC